MFSKSKYAIGKKCKKVMTAALTFALLCGFTGCAKEETGSSAPQSTAARSSSSVKQSVPNNNSEVPQSSAVSSDNTVSSDTQSEQSAVKTEFDFDEAVKNISLFGHKISLPCTIKDFGKDFSLSTAPLDKPLSSGENRVACNLLYKGLKIATVAIADCTPDDDYNEREIDTIMLGFTVDYSNWSENRKNEYFQSLGWYSDLIKVEIGGMSFESSEEYVRSILGEPTMEQPYHVNGKELVYTFFQDDEKHLEKSIVFRYQKNGIVGININFVEK